MKIFNAEFVMGSANVGQYPESDLPEIVFSGRSNVGKSSLINSFVHRKNLARISSTPGKTSEINFFNIEDRWMLVDMPGFGFTKKGVDKRKEWAKLNYAYLEKRENIKLVCSLVDARHDPQAFDLSMIEWLENHEMNYIILLTKCDKLKDSQVAERKEQIEHLVSECNFANDVLPYSSVTDLGRKELMGIVRKFAG